MSTYLVRGCVVACVSSLFFMPLSYGQVVTQGDPVASEHECQVPVEVCTKWEYIVEGGGGNPPPGGGTPPGGTPPGGGGSGRGGLDPGGTPPSNPPSPPAPKPKGKLVCTETSTIVVTPPTCADPDTSESTPTQTPAPPNQTTMSDAADPTPPGATTPSGTGAGNEFFGDPLNFIGEFARSERILNLSGIGLDLDLRLINSSLWTNDSYVGSHWFLNIDWRLFEYRDATGAIAYLSLDSSNGTRTIFVPNGQGLYEATNGRFAKIKPGGGYTLRYANGAKYHFGDQQDGVAWLSYIEDRYGNRITFQRHRSMLIDQITDSRERVVNFKYYSIADLEAGVVPVENLGKLKSIVDPTGRAWTFEYNDAGMLSSFGRPASEVIDLSTNSIDQTAMTSSESRATTYEYDSLNRLTGVVESSNAPNYSLQNTYDSASGRLIRQVNARGAVMEYKFEDLTGVSIDPLSTNVAEMAVLEKGFSGEAHYRVFNGFGQLLESKIYAEDISALDFSSGTVSGLITPLTPLAESYYTYDSEGLLIEVTAPEGNSISVTYNTTSLDRYQRDQILSMTHRPGPRADGGITGNDASDQTISLTYDPVYGGVATITDPANNTSTSVFDYQEASTLSAELQQVINDWQIDIQGGPAIGLGDLNGDGDTSGIVGNVILRASPIAQVVDFTQAGSPTIQQAPIETYQYNDRGQLTHSTDAANYTTQLVYDDDPLSNSFGQAIQVIDALSNTMEYAYDDLGRMTLATNERGVQTQIDYTTLGQISQVVRGTSVDSSKTASPPLPNGETTKVYYDLAGNLVRSEQDQLTLSGIVPGVVTVQRFDAEDNVTSVEQQISAAYGREIEYEYDLSNRLTLVRSPEAVASQAGDADEFNHVRTYYDNLDRPCQVVAAEGSMDQIVNTYVYDSHGNVVARYDAQANAGGNSDGLTGCGGYLAAGEKWTYIYDGFDRVVRVDDPAGGYGLVHYDNRSNAVHAEAWGFVDGPGATGPGPIVKLASVDAVHDELSRLLRIEADYFDTAGNPIMDDGNGDGIVQMRLLPDIRSLTQAVENDNGHVWQNVFDALMRVQTSIDPAGNQADYAYDARGNLTLFSQTDLDATQTATRFERAYAYDVLDHLIQTVDTAGRSSYIYPDFKGRPLYAADANTQIPGSGIVGFNPVGQENAPGNVIARDYDYAGRLVRVDRHLTPTGQGLGQLIPALGSTQIISTGTVYDDNDRVVQRLDGNGYATDYRYDALNRLTEIQYADGDLSNYTYDADGNVIQTIQEDGTQLGYSYDALNRITQLDTISSAVTPVTQRLRYDGLGRVTWLEDSTNLGILGPQVTELQRSYSSLGHMLTEQTLSNGTLISSISARYSGFGQLLELVYPDGTQLEYSYDNAERLDDISINGTLAASYDYIGQRLDARSVWTTTGQQIVSQASYDIGLNMVDWSHFVASSLQAGFASTFDRTGRRTSETRSDLGTVGDVLAMDSAYRMTAFQANVPDASAEVLNPGTGGAPLEDHVFGYDDAGNRTQVTTNGSSTSYISNNMNEYTTIGTQALTYDDRGNLLNDGDQQYSYDALNRLIKIQLSSGDDVHIARDATGRIRGEIQVNGSTIVDYQLLHHAGTQRVQEDDQLAGGSVRLIHGGGLDELVQYSSVNDYYPLSSPLGSAAQLLDNQGTLVERYEYRDGFGQPTFINAAGTEQTDSAVGFDRLYSGARYRHGLYDLRNRQFDPLNGRFTQQDPLGAFADSPNLGNAYSYVSNNPLNGLDPLGLMQDGPGVQNCGSCHLNPPAQGGAYGAPAAYGYTGSGAVVTAQDIMKQQTDQMFAAAARGASWMEDGPGNVSYSSMAVGGLAIGAGAMSMGAVIPAGLAAKTGGGAAVGGALAALSADATVITGARIIVTDEAQRPIATQAYGQLVYTLTRDAKRAEAAERFAHTAQAAVTLPFTFGGSALPLTLTTPQGVLVPAVATQVAPTATTAAGAVAAVAPITEMFIQDNGDDVDYDNPKNDNQAEVVMDDNNTALVVWQDEGMVGFPEPTGRELRVVISVKGAGRITRAWSRLGNGRVAPGEFGSINVQVADGPLPSEAYRKLSADISNFVQYVLGGKRGITGTTLGPAGEVASYLFGVVY